MKFKTDFLTLIAVVLAIFCSRANALDWYYNPSFNYTERYTNNLRLLASNIKPAPTTMFISTLSPTLAMGYLEDDSELNTSFNWNQLLYHEQSNLDFSEKLANLNYLFKGEKWIANLAASYGDQATLGSESVQLGITGAGNVAIQVARYTRTLAPSLTYKIDEKNTLNLSGSYANTNYGAHPASGLGFSPYKSSQISLTATHAYSERLSFNLTGSYNNYNAKNNLASSCNYFRLSGHTLIIDPNNPLPCELNYNQNSDTLNAQIGVNYALNETWSANASVGLRETISHTIETFSPTAYGRFNINGSATTIPDSTTQGKTYAIGIVHNYEKGSISFNGNQQLSPASTGTQQNITQFTSTASYNLSETISTSITGSYLVSDTINSSTVTNASVFNRTLTSITPNLRWQWNEDMFLQLNYTYIEQIYTQSKLAATSDSVQLQFIYQPPINRQVK
ncbi:hypothetical protein [Methylomonas sp. AM2-LC]|uniref:hypothetical protein n=1 Tax=Methylomonas sp. AM2-LC TaxID=3153301 RepID=UPI00326682E0